jgi:N-sulfoglucosamine sulfohydrolase
VRRLAGKTYTVCYWLVALLWVIASSAIASSAIAQPNIVLIVAEDMSPRVGAFGDAVAQTPNIDALAEQGVRYTQVFSASGVCAPNRSALITGVYPQALGTQHMRTVNRDYEAVPPANVKAFPELLRQAGYATGNTAKTDYQFGEPFTVWDINHGNFALPPDLALWRQLPQDKPFFAMINLMSTHESRLATLETQGQGAFGPVIAGLALARAALVSEVTDPADVSVPDYYPDVPSVRESIAQHYDNIHYMDGQVGEIMANLQADDLLDATVVIWITDHGDGLPRAKRSVYDSGLHIPMVIRSPANSEAGGIDARLISIVDLAPSILQLAGVPVPDFMQGQGMLDSETPRHYVFAGRDRMDQVPDRVRAVRDHRYKYIRNYRSELPYFRPLAFRDMFPVMQALWAGNEAGSLNPQQRFYFVSPRPLEELYDTQQDPQELMNLAGQPRHVRTLDRMRGAMDDWLANVGDKTAVDEGDMIESMWPGGEQPMTEAPVIALDERQLVIRSRTPGASIAYRTKSRGPAAIFSESGSWQVYTKPVSWPPENPPGQIEAKAIRYGYAESAVTSFPPN